MLLGYNTNGMAHHDLVEAIELLAEIGYRSVAITLDHGVLNPFDERTAGQLPTVQEALQRHQMALVVETGARFLLDPRHKHEPTLVSPRPDDRQRRVDFLCRAIDMAADLGASSVSLWSGALRDGAPEQTAYDRLVEGLSQVVLHAAGRQMPLSFEPEPGMLVDRMAGYARLLERLDDAGVSTRLVRLTIDIGHLHCQGEVPIADQLRQWADRLVNVHIEDMRRGVHEHLMFGEGEIDFPPVIAALAEIGYAGPVNVELSRHSHEAPTAARRAYDFLVPLITARESD